MKKKLFVLFAAGLLVALAGVPAMAADQGGHVDPEDVHELSSEDILSSNASLDITDVSLDVDDVTQLSELLSDDQVLVDGFVANLTGDISGVADQFMEFVLNGTYSVIFYRDTNGDWHKVTASGDEIVIGASVVRIVLEAAAGTTTVKIYNGSDADLNPSPDVVEAVLVGGNTQGTSGGGGGGCDLLGIAPMAVLLALPMMLLVRR